MIDVLILAIALSMDAFAVSIGLGAKHYPPRSNPRKLALTAALYFGVFQGLMPLVGFLAGKGAVSFIDGYAHWLAFGLLILIGGKMLFEALREGVEEDIGIISQRVMLTLAIATSIDAMAAGFTLTLLPTNPFLACLIIGIITFVLSALGVFIGRRSGTWLESRAEIFGALVLIALAFKFLLF